MIGNKIIGNFLVSSEVKAYSLQYSTDTDIEDVIQVHLKNDLSIPGKEDRNAFVSRVEMVPETIILQ
jgi:hypothetical protein